MLEQSDSGHIRERRCQDREWYFQIVETVDDPGAVGKGKHVIQYVQLVLLNGTRDAVHISKASRV